MKVLKDKTRVSIKTDSCIINGYLHIMKQGRVSDYLSSQLNKFIPITDAEIFPLNYEYPNNDEKKKKGVVFINTSKIELVEYFN